MKKLKAISMTILVLSIVSSGYQANADELKTGAKVEVYGGSTAAALGAACLGTLAKSLQKNGEGPFTDLWGWGCFIPIFAGLGVAVDGGLRLQRLDKITESKDPQRTGPSSYEILVSSLGEHKAKDYIHEIKSLDQGSLSDELTKLFKKWDERANQSADPLLTKLALREIIFPELLNKTYDSSWTKCIQAAKLQDTQALSNCSFGSAREMDFKRFPSYSQGFLDLDKQIKSFEAAIASRPSTTPGRTPAFLTENTAPAQEQPFDAEAFAPGRAAAHTIGFPLF
jgi:hypothetical protein